ncbi:hybrid sensor histidine kinase/response regulator transcription factor [Bacteroides heparinolyticus]|uniref:hybrid sensor histidine kinase/response regulator transcription factor n=1 Tax=Prevotella heparinolytica TaxID=28113 RepID=UPI0035A19891
MAADSTKNIGTSEKGMAMSLLLQDYEQKRGKEHLASADRIFERLFEEEFTESRVTVTTRTPADSVDMLVWYWAGEYFWETQDYDEGIRYARKALPLTYRLGDQLLQGDCEQLVGLLLFRKSDYIRSIEHTRRCLDLNRQTGDKSRISSSLNTLAGICLAAKQLDDGENYILEAIRYSTEAKDSNRTAIQYGMASEIYHAMGKDVHALDYARRAYDMDSVLGNTAKVGIRLSQMAAAQMALGQDAEAERSLKRAVPILEKAGNTLSLSICRNQMGELLNRRGAHTEAVRNFEQAAEVFAARHDMYNESRARMGLYKAMKDGNPSEAGRHLLRYAELKDSIYQRDMEQAVSQQNVQYKTEELIREQEHERNEHRLIVIGSLVLIAMLLIVVGMLTYLSKIRRRNHLALKRLSSLRENFFTNITHEFRTPLTMILALSHDLQATDAAEVRDKAQIIERQGKGLLTLINQLLDISKIKSSVGNADWRNGNITAHLTMIVETYRDYARSRNIDLQFFAKETVEMDFVPDYVNKVINNLLSNAFKFTPEYGKVSVIAWRKDGRLLIDVADTGEGMDGETLAHIFEPFYRGENDTQNIGTGVGLALVKQIMDAVEGTITAESTVGRGTTFHISAPIRNNIKHKMAEVAIENTPLLPKNEPELADSEGDDDQCRLLVIEDNRDIAAYIGSQFADRYAISYAANGEEGLEKALELVPDLIITDLMMPGMDGLEVCRQIRGNEIVNHIPIIVVTAKITEEERIEGIEAGADAYLAKPFNSDELRTRAEKLLSVRRLLQQKVAKTLTESNRNREAAHGHKFNETDMRFLTKVSDTIYLMLSRHKDIDVSAVASIVCMSPRQFYRKTVALTGYTPVAYIQRIKINKAKSLLDGNPQMSLGEIADNSGFSDYSNFVRAFKNVCGITPTEYRRENGI